MTMRFMIVLAVMLVSFAAVAQEKSVPPQPAGAKKPNPSDVVKNTKLGKLPRKSEVDYLETRLQHLLRKIDTNITGREAVPYKLEQARKGLAHMDELHGGWTIQQNEAPDWWQAIPHNGPKDKWLDSWNYWPTLDYSPEAKSLMHKWIPKYKKYLNEKFGTQSTLSSKQLEVQVWDWLVPREKAELKAKINKLEREYARDLESIRDTRSRLAKKKAEIKRKKTVLPEAPSKGENPENGKPQSHKLVSNRPPIENSLPPRKPNNYLVDDALNRTKIIKKDPAKPAEDEIIDAGGDGMLAGKSVKLSHLQGCGTLITGFNYKEALGRVSTRCAGLTGGLAASQADYAAHCKRWLDPNRYCLPPPGSKAKYLDQISSGVPVFKTKTEFRGIDGTPIDRFCYLLHYRLVSSNNTNLITQKIRQDSLYPIFKYDTTNQKLECFFLSKEQAKSLYAEFKNAGKILVDAKPAEIEKPSTSASSTDLNTGEITTSVKNPDGSRTVTKTDKDGKLLSSKTIRKSPASASSTDPNTGETTTSVANPDGSRTVTKADAEGNVLSREKVR